MARRRPTPRLISKRQRKFMRLPLRYLIIIDDSYWPRKFADWSLVSQEEKLQRMHREAERIQHFLSFDRPFTSGVELMLSNGSLEVVPKGKGEVMVQPLTFIRPHPGAPSPGEGTQDAGSDNTN